MQIVCRKPVPAFVYDKAIQSLSNGQVRKTINRSYLVKNVGRHWRLLSKDKGVTWHLMTHSEYNTLIDRRH